MIKISWGTRIAMLYIGFVLLVVLMITLSMQQKVELVSEDYYAKELVYQNKIEEMNNANALSGKITHSISENTFLIQFPEQFEILTVEGEILFFKPSDSSKDFKISLQLDQKLQQHIDLNKFKKGMYKMKISWKAESTPYYIEETIVIP